MSDGGEGLTRRSLFAAGAGVALALAEARSAPARSLRRRRHGHDHGGATAWPLPAHDLAATRHGAGRPGLTERWRASFPGGVPASVATDDRRAYVASAAGAVAALSLRDGDEHWRVELGTAAYEGADGTRQLGFYSGVALAPGAAIVASDRVHCLDPASGAIRWQGEPPRGADSDDYFWGPPAVVGDLVLVGSGSGGETATARGHLSAHRLGDGALLWRSPTVPPGANGGGIIGQVSVDPAAGLAYVATGAPYEAVPGSNPGTCSLLALRLRDGSVAWADQVHAGDSRGFDLNSAPLLCGRRLFVTAKDGVHTWDRVRRRRLWRIQLTDPLPGGAASAGPTAGPEGGPIASDGRRLFALSNDGESFGCVAAALAPEDGRVLWRAMLPTLCFGAPALAGGRLHVSGSDGVLRALDARDGSLVGSAELGEPSAAPVAVGAGRLLVGTGAGPYLPGSSLVCLG